jgi:hypothetical protein
VPVDRRQFLLRVGATGAALALAPQLPASASSARRAAATLDAPTDLHFDIVHQTRPFNLVARRFVQLDDDFGHNTSRRYDVLTPGPEDKAGRAHFRRGRLQVSGKDHYSLFRSKTRQRAPYAGVIVEVESFSEATDAEQDTVLVGLARDDRNFVVGWYNHATRTAGIDLAVDGSTQTLDTATVNVKVPGRVAFGLTSTTVVVLVDSGNGFRPVVKSNLAGKLDLRRPSALKAYHNTFGVRASSGTVTLSSVRAGYFGETGLRDPHLVTYANGRPYLKDGKAYFTFTQAGLAFFETAHWGVWTIDLKTYELEQVGNLFFQRDGMDAVLGDHAGHIVVDEKNDRWILAMSTWGNFSFERVQINYATVSRSKNVLHGVHILKTQQLPVPVEQLPTAHVGQWDPHLVHIGKRWYLGFVNASKFFVFYPALARTAPGADFTALSELVGADSQKNATEGTVLQRFGGTWYLMASNGDDSPAEIRNQYPIYDLSMRQVGALDAPHPTNIPWPMVFPVPLRDHRDKWLLVTFNGTQYYENVLGYGTHGDVIVMRARPVTDGWEFPPRHR